MSVPDPASSRVNGMTAPALVVQVEDTITAALAGRAGCTYASPPLPREETLALVRLLTGRASVEAEDGRWSCPIAGGQRTVILKPAGVPAARETQPA